MSMVDVSLLVRAEDMIGGSEEDTRLLVESLERARAYMDTFHWNPGVSEEFCGGGVGGVVGVYLFRFKAPVGETDSELWVIAGDLPCAYLVTDNAPDPKSALEVYCDLMDDWADAILAGLPLADVFPVDAPHEANVASSLKKRTRFLRDRIVPFMASSTDAAR